MFVSQKSFHSFITQIRFEPFTRFSSLPLYIQNVQTDVDNWQNFDANAPTIDDSTRRLAICNMDWDKITADDLFGRFRPD